MAKQANFVKKSEVRRLAKEAGYRVGGETYGQLDRLVHDRIMVGVGKAKADRRVTLKPEDVI